MFELAGKTTELLITPILWNNLKLTTTYYKDIQFKVNEVYEIREDKRTKCCFMYKFKWTEWMGAFNEVVKRALGGGSVRE